MVFMRNRGKKSPKNTTNTPQEKFSPDRSMHYASVCERLTAQRVFATPVSLAANEDLATLEIDTGFDSFKMVEVSGDLSWVVAAYKLGGLFVRVLPSSDPSRISILASWENQVISLSGHPL
jgi:hypothetical protein